MFLFTYTPAFEQLRLSLTTPLRLSLTTILFVLLVLFCLITPVSSLDQDFYLEPYYLPYYFSYYFLLLEPYIWCFFVGCLLAVIIPTFQGRHPREFTQLHITHFSMFLALTPLIGMYIRTFHLLLLYCYLCTLSTCFFHLALHPIYKMLTGPVTLLTQQLAYHYGYPGITFIHRSQSLRIPLSSFRSRFVNRLTSIWQFRHVLIRRAFYFSVRFTLFIGLSVACYYLMPLIPLADLYIIWTCTWYMVHVEFCADLREVREKERRRNGFRTQSKKRLRTRAARKLQARLHFASQAFSENLSHASYTLGVTDESFRSFVSIIESVFMLTFQLADASNNKMRGIAVAAFVKSINGGQALSIDLLERAAEAFTDHNESQSFIDYINAGKDSYDRFKGLRNSPGMSKIYTFMMYVLSLGFFSKAGLTMSKAGFSRMEAAALERKHSSKMGFIDSLVDMASFICTSGYQAYQGLSIDHILHSPAVYGKFYDDVEVFGQDFERYQATNLAAGVEHTNLLDRLSKLLAQYREIEVLMPQIERIDRKIILSIRGKLLSYSAVLKNEKICQSSRLSPFSLLLVGDSGVGKSVLTEILFSQFGKLRGLSTDSEMKYCRSPTQEFWDNFDPKMWCLVLDDIAWQHAAADGIDQSVSELLHIVNNVPYVTNQASLEKKGSTPFLGQFVIGTTNTHHLNANNYFAFPAAARRRFPFVVHVSVKEEYANKYGNLLGDVAAAATTYPDFWNFTIKNVVAEGREVHEITVGQFSRVGDFLTWFNGAVDKFYDTQGQAMDGVKFIHSAIPCTTCRIPTTLCDCDRLYFPDQEDRHTSESLIVAISAFTGGLMFFAAFQRFFAVTLPIMIQKAIYVVIQQKITSLRVNVVQGFYHYTGQTRRAFVDTGHRVQTRVVKVPKLFIIFGTMMVAGSLIWSLLNISSQGNITSMTRERSDYFYSDNIEVTKFNGSLKSKCIDIDALANKVARNIIHASVSDRLVRTECRLLGIGGNYYLTNNHSIPDDPQNITIRAGRDRNGVAMTMTSVITENDVSRLPSKDLAIIRLVTAPPRAKITEFFMDELPSGNAEGMYVDRSESGDISRNVMKHITYADLYVSDLKVYLFSAKGSADVKTYRGQCGMPLLARCGQNKAILGIHSTGSTSGFRNQAGSTIVLKSYIKEMMKSFDAPIISAGEPVLHSQSITREVGGLHPKSVFRYIENGVASLHGSIIGSRPTQKSNVCDTPIRESVEKRGISTTFTKPVTTGYLPWRNAALDMVNPVSEITTEQARRAGDSYLAHIRKSLPEGALKLLQRYDEFTAINGAQGIAFVDGVKRGTSAGAPFRQSKKHHLEKEEPQRGLDDPVKLAPEMSERVKTIRERYRRGESYTPLFTAHLKDEAVSAKKAKIGKTRVVCGSPFDWNVVVRELFLSHVRLMQNFKFLFECGVGTVAPSEEWTATFNHITKHGTHKIVAGDYKAYDKRMPPVFILEAFRILIELATESGNFSDEDILAMWCVAQDTAYPFVDYNGDLVTFWGSNPSGHPLTVIINSIANSLYMRWAYEQCGNDVMTFSDFVALMTYGDDNIMSVSDEKPNFNHTTIQSVLGAVGVVYTMADKEAESIPYIHISAASFLKREWRWNSTEQVYTAPLDEKSIHKMLCVFVRSKMITPGEQITETIRAAHEEWWHYGEVVFEEKSKLLKDVIVECELESYFAERPLNSYSDLWRRFKDCSLKTRMSL